MKKYKITNEKVRFKKMSNLEKQMKVAEESIELIS